MEPGERVLRAAAVVDDREEGLDHRHRAVRGELGDRGLADQRTLERLAEGWNRWARRDDGIFLMPSVEILARN